MDVLFDPPCVVGDALVVLVVEAFALYDPEPVSYTHLSFENHPSEIIFSMVSISPQDS